jgi:PHD/YefM family antitoxin component YafN of YafNO toxin-antitoxin module
MAERVMQSESVEVAGQNVLADVIAGTHVLVEREHEPVAVVIGYAEYVAFQEAVEDLYDLRAAEAGYAEYLRDPESAVDWETLRKELLADDSE